MKLDPSDPNLETLVARIDSGALNLQPDFQRGEVWGTAKKQRLIDSVLRGWHIPPLHIVFDQETGARDVLDGQQRLAAIRDFVHEEFPVNGDIPPYDADIQSLDGLYYNQLPAVVYSKFNDYSIRTFILTEYGPEEPGELFFRLNQPTNLTSAEQRNAFYGHVRQQIKKLVQIAEEIGINKGLIGFSNSRMAYDDVLAKVALTLEQGTLHKKITGGTVTERYRSGYALQESIFQEIVHALEIFRDSVNQTSYRRFNKATFYTWILFCHQAARVHSNAGTDIAIANHAGSILRGFHDLIYERASDADLQFVDYLTEDEWPILKGLLEIYSDRATSRVSDVSSVLLRDFVIWCVAMILGFSTGNSSKDRLAQQFLDEWRNSHIFGGYTKESEAYSFIERTNWDIYDAGS